MRAGEVLGGGVFICRPYAHLTHQPRPRRNRGNLPAPHTCGMASNSTFQFHAVGQINPTLREREPCSVRPLWALTLFASCMQWRACSRHSSAVTGLLVMTFIAKLGRSFGEPIRKGSVADATDPRGWPQTKIETRCPIIGRKNQYIGRYNASSDPPSAQGMRHAYPAADLRWLLARADGNDDEERWGDRVLRIVRR